MHKLLLVLVMLFGCTDDTVSTSPDAGVDAGADAAMPDACNVYCLAQAPLSLAEFQRCLTDCYSQ